MDDSDRIASDAGISGAPSPTPRLSHLVLQLRSPRQKSHPRKSPIGKLYVRSLSLRVFAAFSRMLETSDKFKQDQRGLKPHVNMNDTLAIQISRIVAEVSLFRSTFLSRVRAAAQAKAKAKAKAAAADRPDRPVSCRSGRPLRRVKGKRKVEELDDLD
eukprot:s120_g12.t1